MLIGLVCALSAAVANGSAVVLQAIAANQEPAQSSLRVQLLLRLIRSPVYLSGLLLTALGFLLALVALRYLPLFVVQAARASSLGVVAVLSVLVLGASLRPRDLVALGGVALGLVLLGVAAEPSASPDVELAARGALLVMVGVLAVAAIATARRPGPRSGLVLAVIAGGAFAMLGVAGRVLVDPLDPVALLADPAAWALAASGIMALLTFATALQRGSVTRLTAVMVATETVFGSAAGLVLLDDRASPGRWPLAATGFGIAVGSALALVRVGPNDSVR